VKGLVVAGAAADPVEGGVDEAEVPAGVLIGQGDDRCPQRSGGAGPGGPGQDVVLAAVGGGQGHAGAGISVGGHVGRAPGGPDAGDAVLVGGPGEQPAEAAAGGVFHAVSPM
jgi:hypothetical protein